MDKVDGLIDDLAELNDLHQRGLLTDEELEAARTSGYGTTDATPHRPAVAHPATPGASPARYGDQA